MRSEAMNVHYRTRNLSKFKFGGYRPGESPCSIGICHKQNQLNNNIIHQYTVPYLYCSCTLATGCHKMNWRVFAQVALAAIILTGFAWCQPKGSECNFQTVESLEA